jgi:serine/threonine-protein kinase RsbW
MKLLKNLLRIITLKTNNKNREKKLIVKSRTENLSDIRNFIYSAAQDAGISKEIIDDIILAVDEACTNIIKHAYKYYPDGEIIINLKYNNHKFTIIIVDHGASFEPDVVPEPDLEKYYRQRKVGGLGMFLMKRLMDEVKYVSIPGKYNQVLLSKNLNSGI